MDYKEKLNELRGRISAVDRELLALFKERMVISTDIAEAKLALNKAILDEKREAQVLEAAALQAQPGHEAEIISFMRTLMAYSKLRQSETLLPQSSVSFPPSASIDKKSITAAYQGVAGAWGEYGAAALFPEAELINFDYFDDVFKAVKQGKADFGVLPIENSQTGAIGEVYDLLRKNGCFITGQVWITVRQCLLCVPGANASDIKEIYSHPQGFAQCGRFLKNKNYELTSCRNTAFAAQTVAQNKDKKYAAIGSRRAAEVFGLDVLVPDIMDNLQNKTRFIAISAKPVYDTSCDIISVSFSTSHTSGALCAVLENFMLAGINLTRIESRPVSANNYRFFADLQANILDGSALEAIRKASVHCDFFEILGCYKAISEPSPELEA